MRTLIIIVAGFVLLAICLYAGRLFGRAGTSTIFLAIFGLPAAAAGFAWWKLS